MGTELQNTEPIKIIVPLDLYDRLEQDARLFEVFRNNGETIVLNSLISALLSGYYERYMKEISGRYEDMKGILENYIQDPARLDQVIRKLIVKQAEEESRNVKEEETRPLHIRPTKRTDLIMSEIAGNTYKTGENISEFYRRMFYSYLRLPIYERERIIYHETVEVLERACRDGREVSFSIRDKKMVHRAVPYKLVHGLDERYNYLLCQEPNAVTGKPMASSFRLSRIRNPYETLTEGTITEQIQSYLNAMETYGPQHSLNEDIVTCIELNEAGRRNFQSIYHDRPVVYDAEKPQPNGRRKYYFRCSQNQLFLYFRRFNPGEAKVLYPEKLAEQIRDFHEKSLAN